MSKIGVDKMGHSKEELGRMVEEMDKVTKTFYSHATRIGHHPFIEFCGLMREYVTMCSAALANGEDFTSSSVHTGEALPMLGHHAFYLAEKFECIFGPTFAANHAKAVTFVEAAFPGFTLVPMPMRDTAGEFVPDLEKT